MSFVNFIVTCPSDGKSCYMASDTPRNFTYAAAERGCNGQGGSLYNVTRSLDGRHAIPLLEINRASWLEKYENNRLPDWGKSLLIPSFNLTM